MSQAIPTSARPNDSAAYRAYVLFILIVVYTFNFIDRQIIGILAVPIKEDLNLSDTELSLMGGLAFALFYTALGIPIAMLADRKNRVWIITIALSIWSMMTAVCGFANNFWQLFLARLGVGVGEAGGVAPAYSLIADYFPPNKRAQALGIYSFGIPIGSALGIILGGVITSLIDWRAAFITVGVLGIMIAPLFRLTLREPPRGRYDPSTVATAPPKIKQTLLTLGQKRSFWLICLGAASSSMMGYGLMFWLPSFFVRSYGVELAEFFAWMPEFMVPGGGSPLLFASYFYGTIILIGGVAGIYGGGLLGDWLGEKKKTYYLTVPAIAFLATTPAFALGMVIDNLALAFFIFLIPTALGLAWLGPVLSSIQHVAPPNMRAVASAIFLFITNLIGIGLGNFLIGLLSDILSAGLGEESLRYSILAGTSFYLIAAVFFFLAARTIDKDWER